MPATNWLSHFTHTLSNQIRDGGNIPALHARSQGRDTKLIGLTCGGDGGQILVRVNSGIHSVSELRGRRVGIYRRGKTDRVDFWRATAERGILLSLKLSGLKREEVEWVDLTVDGPDYPSETTFDTPAKRFSSVDTGKSSHYGREIAALLDGTVDAIYSNSGRAQLFQASGEVKAIEDLRRYPDWTLQVANSPYAITVSSDFAAKHRDVVVAFLRASVRAGRWVHEHRRTATQAFGQILPHWGEARLLKSELSRHQFIPGLSARALAGLDVEKRFLLEQGYIDRDFDVNGWADTSFLEEALAGIKKEAA
jgi:ABC-type nitrate/sulfonate/bicarbonate transport system substrate-binding protein